ncbi:hypothetical protein Vafri_9087 [Volvox africanus]|uniref:Uncharacterized protein n=1 Tax=Volvox africanus TaxID=51714 RepID=A0A8J4B568_9CHLO|nr:hypothetical protein Vafri_9087 [Volvox africanus]
MLGAAADASLPPSGSSSRSQSSGALAAAAAASINGVEITHRRVTSNTVGSGSGSGGVRRQWSAASGSAAVSITRAPPPGPMDGGFLPESDPVQRLWRHHGRCPSREGLGRRRRGLPSISSSRGSFRAERTRRRGG